MGVSAGIAMQAMMTPTNDLERFFYLHKKTITDVQWKRRKFSNKPGST
jgi:hypothetical protein